LSNRIVDGCANQPLLLFTEPLAELGDTFLAKTTSKSFAIRLYYFLFAVALYDIWVLTNVLLGVVFDDAQRDRPLIPSRVFARLLEKAARPTNPPP
jgi:hypothetical protein